MSKGTVWITGDVALPQEVLDAQAEGRLVFFVGAGASIDDPSGLPLFGELARELAELARVPYDLGTMTIDYFLGELPEGFETHIHAHGIIANSSSRPNSMHEALVRLADARGPLRIVTTNFDNHLAAAAAVEGVSIGDQWVGPALPLGESFEGLVHLHGSVLRDPRELVLTDQDFGRGYLTAAWATRFLLPMFQSFTVLFVGYSHDDPIMRYLALGLPSRTPRFAFTSTESAAETKWRRLGVQPVSYPVVANDHGALVRALMAWEARARMGQLEHRARVAEIVTAGPTLTPVDRDYLIGRLQTVEGAQEFVAAAASLTDPLSGLDWLHWIEELPDFKQLFLPVEIPEHARVLGDWFTETFVASPDLHGAALQTLHRLGQSLSGYLMRSASRRAEQLHKSDPIAGERWRVLLATSIPGQTAPAPNEILLPYLPNVEARSRSILRTVLRPSLVLKRRWISDPSDTSVDPPDAEVRWNCSEHALTLHVLKAVRDAEPGDIRLGSLLEESLSEAYDLLDSYHGPHTMDFLSFRRSAIEPHEQDAIREPLDSIVDALRQYGERALTLCPDLPSRWWSFDRSLFKRLALHLIATDPSLPSDAKLKWLLDRTSLYANDIKHESYGVLKVAVPEASDSLKSRVLAAVEAVPEAFRELPDGDHHVAYAKYNLLVWLTHSAPDWDAATLKLQSIQSMNPTFSPRSHPDFDKWMTSGSWGGRAPIAPEALIERLGEDPAAALQELLSRDYSQRDFHEPTWRDAMSLVEEVAQRRPDLGVSLWDAVSSDGALDRADDFRGAITEGWAKADLGKHADAVLGCVRTSVAHQELAHSIGRFLMEQAKNNREKNDTALSVILREVAKDLWKQQNESFAWGGDALSFAPLYLNSWPGFVAQFWMLDIERRWRQDGASWTGFTLEEAEVLAELISASDGARAATQPALASELFFLFSADPDFAARYLLPLFREDDSAVYAWHPYLHHPRFNDRLLEMGLFEATKVQWHRLEALGEQVLQGRFYGLVASIVTLSGITPEERQELLDLSVLVDEGAHAAAFAHELVRLLDVGDIEGRRVWIAWLREHLCNRLKGIPRRPQPEELARWADLVPYLGDAIPEAVTLLEGAEIGLGEGFFVPDLSDDVLGKYGTELVAHYAQRVEHTTSQGPMVVHEVERLIDRLRAGVPDGAVQPILEAATKRGLSDCSQ